MTLITNDIINSLRLTDSGYTVCYSGRCMRQGKYSYGAKLFGGISADRIIAYVPDAGADIRKGDHIVFGDFSGDFSPMSALTAESVSVYDYGSENMRHLRITAV